MLLCGIVLTLLTGRSLFSQSGVNLEDVGNAELGTMLNGYLKSRDLYGAAPVLEEFRKRMLSGELSKRNLEKISFYIGLGYMEGYSRKQDKTLLRDAAREFQHYMDTFPRGADIRYVVMNKVDCHRGNHEFLEAIPLMEMLLNARKPFLRKLRSHERMSILEKLVQDYYYMKLWEKGIPWFERLLQFSDDTEQTTLAAAALVEAYVAQGHYEDIENLLPYLDTATQARFQPRLNFQFLQAGDRLVELEENAKASLFYYLTMTPKEISTSYSQLLEDLEPKLWYYRKKKEKFGKNFPKTDEKRLSEAEFQWKSLTRKKQKVDDWLKSPSKDYSKDLLWRRAQNYREMGRDWEAYWGFMGLVMDYPDVETDLKEKYIYASIIQALKIGKTEQAMELAEEFLGSPEYEKYAGHIGLLLARMYLDEAKELSGKAEVADTLPQMEAFKKQAGAAYDSMWEVGKKLLEKPLSEENGDMVVSMMGATWIHRGHEEPEKWDALIETFGAYLANEENANNTHIRHGLHYWVGMALLYQSQYKPAHVHFDALVTQYPKSSFREEALFRRGVCAKGMKDFATARKNLMEFVGDYSGSRFVPEAEVFLGDMARDEKRDDVAKSHYDHVVFVLRYDQYPKDFQFIDHALYEWLDLVVKPKSNAVYKEAIEILQRYVATHPDGDVARAYLEMTKYMDFLDDPIAVLEQYLWVIKKEGNKPESAGVDDTLRQYFERYPKYYLRFYDTERFLSKLKTDRNWRNKVLADRNELLPELPNFKSLDSTLRDRFVLNEEFRVSVMKDISLIETDLKAYQGKLKAMTSLAPEVALVQLFQDTLTDGRETLKYRLMMFFDYNGLLQEAVVELPSYFDVSHFEKASPNTLYWMAEHNLKNGSIIAVTRAKLALDRILKQYPGTENGELPALLLLAKMEQQNAEKAANAKERALFYTFAYKYYKLAYDQYPTSDSAGIARMGQADMSLALGDATSAILIYRDILKFSRRSPSAQAEATFKVGKSYYEQGHVEKAFPYFEATYVKYQS